MTFASPIVLNQRVLFQHSTTLYSYDKDDPHSGSCVANGKLAPAAGTGCISALRSGLSSIGGMPTGYFASFNGFGQVPTNVGTYATFFADDGTNGKELWQTDGTPAGTSLKFAIAAGSAGFEFGANQHKVDGLDGVFFQNYSGQNISLWHYSNPAQSPTLLSTFASGASGATIQTLSVDPSKQHLLITTSSGSTFVLPIGGGVATRRASNYLSQITTISDDGFYYYEAIEAGGGLKRRNFDRSVDTITGLSVSGIPVSSGFLAAVKIIPASSDRLTVSCQSATDCDIYKILG